MLKRIVFVLSLFLMTGGGAPVMAQAVDDPGLSEVEGLESGYARLFMVDLTALYSALGNPGAAVPDIDLDGPLVILTAVLTFDSARNAEQAIELLPEFTDDTLATSETERVELDDLGDRALLFSGEDEEGELSTVRLLVVQEGELVYMVMAGSSANGSGEEQVKAIAEFMLAGTPGTGEVALDPHGMSTGGVFDVMPTEDDVHLIGDLTIFADVDMLADDLDLSQG